MTQQTINLGPSNNPSSGDSLRIALTKTNSNFTDLYSQFATLTAASLGAVAVSELNVANGVATLGSDGKLLSTQVPSGLSGGSSDINFGAPVVTNSLSNNQIIVYSSADMQWENISQVYQPGGCFIGTPTTGQTLYSWFALANAEFPINFVGSVATVLTAPTSGSATFNIHQNTSVIGTITFASGSTTGVFASVNTSTPTIVNAGDYFYITVSSINGFATFIFGLSGSLS